MRRLLCSLILLFFPSFCLAWGGEGHQLVALIAEDHLTPAAKAMVKDLLEGRDISDAEVASWADEERRVERETAAWHYVNIPHDANAFDRQRDGTNDANVIDAIELQAKILADKSQPREKRVEALKYIVHLVGDIHQPLHCADRNGDKGGNARLLFWLDRRKADNLHSVWDTGLVREFVGRRKIADAAYAIARTITAQQHREWERGAPEEWANESHAVAVKIYEKVAEDGPPPKLGRDYVEANVPIVADRLKRGGVRLAMVLNAVVR